MTTFSKTLTLVILLVFTFSCNKGKETGRFYLTEEMKSQLPYKSHESISFVNSNDEIFTFSGGSRIIQDIEIKECISCYDYYVYEEELINFNNGSDQIRISIRASESNYLKLRFGIDGHVFFSEISSPLSPENISGHEYFLDSISVNNIVYYEVYKDSIRSEKTITINQYPIYSYYSTEYGVLKIDFSDNTCWEYVKIN